MSPNQWGPPTWIFMHTLPAQLLPESFALIGAELIHWEQQICRHLPCPDCTVHAGEFWRKVKTSNIRTATDLENLLFVFHNAVNKRKRQPPFRHADLQYYKTRNVIETFNAFARNYHTHGNMNLINESFHRDRMLQGLRAWLMRNLGHFGLPAVAARTPRPTVAMTAEALAARRASVSVGVQTDDDGDAGEENV